MAEADQPDLPGNVCAYKLTPHDRNLAGLSHQTHQQFAPRKSVRLYCSDTSLVIVRN